MHIFPTVDSFFHDNIDMLNFHYAFIFFLNKLDGTIRFHLKLSIYPVLHKNQNKYLKTENINSS